MNFYNHFCDFLHLDNIHKFQLVTYTQLEKNVTLFCFISGSWHILKTEKVGFWEEKSMVFYFAHDQTFADKDDE